MANQEFVSALAKEMRDKYNERNEELERIEKSPYSEWLKEQMRKEIMENFEKQMNKMKAKPWYKEARKTHLEQVKSNIKLAKSKKEQRLRKNKNIRENKDASEWPNEELTNISKNELCLASELVRCFFTFNKRYEEKLGYKIPVLDPEILSKWFVTMKREHLDKYYHDKNITSRLELQRYIFDLCRKYRKNLQSFGHQTVASLDDYNYTYNRFSEYENYILKKDEKLYNEFLTLKQNVYNRLQAIKKYINSDPVIRR